MDSRNLCLVMGGLKLENAISRAEIQLGSPGEQGGSWARVFVSTEILADSKIDYRTEAQIVIKSETSAEPLFTGIVDEVIPRTEITEIRLVTGTQLLAESLMGGMGIAAGTNFLEVSWSLLRSFGIGSDRIQIEGYAPGPLELFEVAAPIDGVDLGEPIEFNGVRFLPDGPVSRLATSLGPDELRESYEAGPAWVHTLQAAQTLWEAEAAGIRSVNIALAWIEAYVRFSAPVSPTGSPWKYSRKWERSKFSHRNIFVTRGLATERRWIRQTTDLPNLVRLNSSEIPWIHRGTHPWSVPIEMDHALQAWHQASRDADRLSAIVGLWDAIEFYVSLFDSPVEYKFTRAEKQAIRKAATKDLTEDKRSRVIEALQLLNQPSLMVSLKAALDQDGVPYTEMEWDLLRKLRKVRNDSIHGRSPRVPEDAEVRWALATVNRMLMYRLSRISGWSPAHIPSIDISSAATDEASPHLIDSIKAATASISSDSRFPAN